MKDSEYLQWLYNRFINVYDDNENIDYLIRLKEIIKTIEENENNFENYMNHLKNKTTHKGMIDNFNANQAKEIVDSFYNDELNDILNEIKIKAKEGQNVLHIYKSLQSVTKQELTNRGFNIIDHPSIAIQKDGLYYSINW